MARRRNFPQLPASIDNQLRQYLSALQEMIETGEGARGDPLDRKLTFRDLIDSGVAKLKGRLASGQVIDGGQIEPGNGVPDLSTPPRPEDVSIIPVFDAVAITWSIPQAAYSNHAFTEIWRATGENAPFETAVRIGTDNGSMYSDYTVAEGEIYTYWIRFVSTDGVNSPWHNPAGTSVTAMVSVERMLEELSGSIDESQLTGSLNERIDKIEVNELATKINKTAIENEIILRTQGDDQLASQISTVSAVVNENKAAIQTETIARATADQAMAQQITTLFSSVGQNTAAIKAEATTRADKDSVLAQQIDTVQTNLGNDIGSIQQSMLVQGNKIAGLSAEYTLKLDVNGYVSGFGTYNNGKTSDFAVVADRFWIAPPNSTGKVKPFIVSGGNVYIDTAFIRNASIQEGKLGPISFGKIKDSNGHPVTTLSGKLKADNIDVDNLNVNFANVSGELRSTNYSAGSRGWKINTNGDAEFNDLTVRTTVYANDIIGGINVSKSANKSVSKSISGGSSFTYVTKFTATMPSGAKKYRPFFCITATGNTAAGVHTGVDIRVDVWVNSSKVESFYSFAMAWDGMGVTVSGSTSGDYAGGSTFGFDVYVASYEEGTRVKRTSGYYGGLA